MVGKIETSFSKETRGDQKLADRVAYIVRRYDDGRFISGDVAGGNVAELGLGSLKERGNYHLLEVAIRNIFKPDNTRPSSELSRFPKKGQCSVSVLLTTTLK